MTQTGFGGQQATWTITWGSSDVSSSTNQYQCTADLDTCVGSDVYGTTISSQVVQSISASSPGNDTLTYSFSYDGPATMGWGELRQITLPQSPADTAPATVTYGYQQGAHQKQYADLLYNPVIRKEVDWQEQQDGQSTLVPDVWTYSYGAPTIVTGPDGGQTQYFFLGSYGLQNLAYKIVLPDLSEIDRTWHQNRPVLSLGVDPGNPYVQVETHIVGGLRATKTHSFDKNGNQTSVTESDWGGGTLRTTTSVYNVTTADASSTVDDTNAYWNPSSQEFRSLLTKSTITSGSGATVAVHEYSYDPTACGSCGDLTEERHWNSAYVLTQPLTRSNAVVIDRQYDTIGAGTLTQITDGRSLQINYVYDSNYLYVVQKTEAGVRHTGYVHDSNTGLVTRENDLDNGTYNTYSYDALGRMTSTSEAVGTSAQRWTFTTYEDARRRTILKDAIGRVFVTEYDQLHRPALTRQLENPNLNIDDSTIGIKVQTRYKNVNGGTCNTGVSQCSSRMVSNPYRASASSGASGEETMGWVLTTLDTMGRVTRTEKFSGASLPGPWGSNGSSTGYGAVSYSANTSTLVDESRSASWTKTFDGVGRLSSVTENGISATTTYTYNALDNLLGVNQTGQSRSFVYDSLGRLTQANNPESGITCYAYDNDGNLASRTQAANSQCTPGVWIATTYAYDGLNRITSKTTPEGMVAYTYDQGPYGMGRLYSVSFGAFTTYYGVHDALGRVTDHTQYVNGQPYRPVSSIIIPTNWRRSLIRQAAWCLSITMRQAV